MKRQIFFIAVAVLMTACGVKVPEGYTASNKHPDIYPDYKDVTVPVSMAFRLFGSIASGLLVTELIYNYIYLSIGLPVIVGVLFTCFHAIIQAYVFAVLSSLFVGEAAVPAVKPGK